MHRPPNVVENENKEKGEGKRVHLVQFNAIDLPAAIIDLKEECRSLNEYTS